MAAGLGLNTARAVLSDGHFHAQVLGGIAMRFHQPPCCSGNLKTARDTDAGADGAFRCANLRTNRHSIGGRTADDLGKMDNVSPDATTGSISSAMASSPSPAAKRPLNYRAAR